MKLIVLCVLLWYTFQGSYGTHSHRREWQISIVNSDYELEREPRIRAYSPKGLGVTVDGVPGLLSVRFVGTVYRDAKNVPVEGTFVLDTARRRRRKWVYENTDVALKVGDILNYEIFMEGKGGSSFKTYDGNAEIFELLNLDECRLRYCRPSNQSPYEGHQPAVKGVASVPSTEKPSTPEPVNVGLLELKLRTCQQSIVNITNVLLDLQSHVLRLETKNELLAGILSSTKNSKQLTVSGVIPQEGTAVETVNFLLWEKLDIKPHITSAQRKNATTIVFEVETLDEKLDILQEAEDRLASGRIKIY